MSPQQLARFRALIESRLAETGADLFDAVAADRLLLVIGMPWSSPMRKSDLATFDSVVT